MQVDRSKFSGGEDLFGGVVEANLSGWLVGIPGASKTMVALGMSARGTRGLAPGDFKGTPFNVLYVSIENRFNRSIGPRFDAAKGDFARFFHHDKVIPLPTEMATLRRLIRKHKARLCFIDPIKDHLDHGVYTNQAKSGDFLVQIEKLAEDTECAIICIDWPSKSAKKGDLSNSGNQSFTGKPRQILQVGRLSVDEWVVGTSKVSEGTPFTGWVYTMEPIDLDIIDAKTGRPIMTARVKWLRPARPSEVMRARQQIDLEEDPGLTDLLEYMAPGGDGVVAEFKTKDLLTWMVNSLVVNTEKKGRALLKGCGAAGYIERIPGTGKGADSGPTWKITDLGVLKLAPDEESVEAVMEKLFPSMDPEPLPQQLALPPTSPHSGT